MSIPETYSIDKLGYDLRRLSNAISDIYLILDDDTIAEGKRLPVARYAVRQALADLTSVHWKMCHVLDDVGDSAPAANELAADPDGRCHGHATPAANDAHVDEVDARWETGNDVDK